MTPSSISSAWLRGPHAEHAVLPIPAEVVRLLDAAKGAG